MVIDLIYQNRQIFMENEIYERKKSCTFKYILRPYRNAE